MFLRFIAVAAAAATAMAIGIQSNAAVMQKAQVPQTRISLDSDIRIFTVAAALNAASSDSTSTAAGKFGTDLDPELLRQLKQFYSVHKGSRSDESQYAKYIGLAVSVTDPPDLKPKLKEEQLPDDTRALLGFLPLLRQFYSQGHISQRWSDLHPQYDAELARLQPKISAVFLQTDAYLRSSLSGAGARLLHIETELQAPPNSVNMRVLQDDYYLVLGPSTTANMDDVRHAYFHFHLDDVVNRSLSKIADKEKLQALIADEKDVEQVFAKSFGAMIVESLIRAMELRMDRAAAVHAQEAIADDYRSGLLLAPYFYEALQGFQGESRSFGDVFPTIAAAINFSREQERFVSTFHSIPRSATRNVSDSSPDSEDAPAPPIDPVRALIVEAQTAYNSMDNESAKGLFEKVLRDHDPNNGAALYGLGLLASRASDIEQSQAYFERTVKSNSADPAMKVWSYIYLGHIADLQCHRDRAVEYYRQAVQVGDNSREAQASAASGLTKPFGGQCQ